MRYHEIIEDILAGKLVRNTMHSEKWFKMGNDGVFYTNDRVPASWAPDLQALKQATWEVKPEEIYIWGVTNARGTFIAFDEKSETHFTEKEIFPSKKQKYRLVPIEDHEL